MLLCTKDVPRFLGYLMVGQQRIMDPFITKPQQLPRALSELASREELSTWLSRVLIYTIVPGTGDLEDRSRVRLPNNLVAFMNLLIHLHAVGFPSHWLTDIVHCIISDNLVTDITPYLGKWPIPVSDSNKRVTRRKVRLDPWLAELETIVATGYKGIPFALSLPSKFVHSYTEIGIFEAKITAKIYGPGSTPGLPVYDPVVSLLLYKPNQRVSGPKAMVSLIPAIFEGRTTPPAGDLFIFTTLEYFDLPLGRVQWKISRNRIQKMKADGWYLVAYRSDTKEPSKSLDLHVVLPH